MSSEFSRLDRFDVLLRRRAGKVSASIPALGLVASASDVATALGALDEKKKTLEAELVAADLTDLVEEPRIPGYASAQAARAPGDLRQFAIKAVIVIGLITAAFITSGALLAVEFTKAADRAKEMTKIGGAPFWQKVETELGRAADPKTDLPEAQKRQLLADIRAIVARWRPFVAEIAPLFSDLQGARDQAAKNRQ